MSCFNENVSLYRNSPVVAKIALSYSPESQEDFDILPSDIYPSDATVIFNLYINNPSGDKIIDGLICDFEVGSDGVYIGTETPSPEIVDGRKYFWEFFVESSSGIFQTFCGFQEAECNQGDGQ